MALATPPHPSPPPALQDSPVYIHDLLYLEVSSGILSYYSTTSKAACQLQTKMSQYGSQTLPVFGRDFLPMTSLLSSVRKPALSLCPPSLSFISIYIDVNIY
ncbi:unnamed protein product [Rangifer tarandus platyrhynchus]|uniref:Uncharacterized protein n=2 Tax=Rangifer tarandus platyrhynchus TaxID=3082113 RepID=A0ABN8ZBF8_RANTA|nr:unnamed protein product [Rangifer tarandus platyrhynchus]